MTQKEMQSILEIGTAISSEKDYNRLLEMILNRIMELTHCDAVKFRKKPTKEELIDRLEKFSGFPQEAGLPSAPKHFIQYLEEDNRPQVSEDVNYENGMGVSIGRLREDTVYDWKFIGLSHNTVRGAAGGAVLCAELLTKQGYITAK